MKKKFEISKVSLFSHVIVVERPLWEHLIPHTNVTEMSWDDVVDYD